MSQITEKIIHFSKGSIGTSEVQLTSTSQKLVNGLLIIADPNNGGVVYIGTKGVTADSAAATDGLPLEAGDSITIEVLDPSLIYLIASASDQKVFVLGT